MEEEEEEEEEKGARGASADLSSSWGVTENAFHFLPDSSSDTLTFLFLEASLTTMAAVTPDFHEAEYCKVQLHHVHC